MLCSFAISVPFWIIHATQHGRCSGFQALVLNAVFNVCLLALFVNFHQSSYKERTDSRRHETGSQEKAL